MDMDMDVEEADTLDAAMLFRQFRGEAPEQRLARPRGCNHWAIPCAVILSALLWVGFAVDLVCLGARQPTGETLLLATAAGVASATTPIYIWYYLLRRSAHGDHQVLLDELERLRKRAAGDRQQHQAEIMEVRKRMTVAAAENRQLLLQILDRMNNVNEAHYAGMAEGVRMATGTDDAHTADVLRLTRRPGS